MDAKKILMNSMTSLEKEDMAGKNEWLQQEPPGGMVRGINSNYSAGDFENPLWVMFFNPTESSARSLA